MNQAAFVKHCSRRVLAALLVAGSCSGMYGSGLPMFFIPQQASGSGQAGYLLRAPGLSGFFTPSGAVFEARRERFELRFLGARPQTAIEAMERLPGKVNYLVGSRPEGWKTGIPTYGAIVYRELYPGIDLLYEVDQARLKSEFRVEAGADPGRIRWRYEGAGAPRVSPDGGLVLAVAGGELTEHKPVLYQETDGRRVAVEGGFRVLEDGSAGFRTGPYDRSRALVIDPVLSYSTYLGGGGLDWARAIAVDASGNAYVAGYTDSSDFPLANPYQASRRGGVDAFVAKLDPAGTALVYCTYLGGSYDDRAFGVAVDGAGNAYLTGWTYSANFPTTIGARQRALGGGRDAFVVKLSAAGNALVYSTFLGGSSHDSGNAVAVDASGNAHVAGDTYSTNFPVLNGFRSSASGGQDAFAAKLNAAGSSLVWSTYLGGNGNEGATALALDAAGNVHLTGGTTSSNFPTYQALQGASGGGQDVFVAKLSSGGSTLLFSTYLGGSGGTLGAGESGTGIAADADGNVYVTGYTSSTNFPTANAYRSTHSGGTIDSFVAKLNAGGNTLVYSTYFGGRGVDYANGIAVELSGAAAVAGYTSSSDLPVVAALQKTKAGSYDGFVARLSSAGNSLDMATYFGGSSSDTASALATDAGGNMWIAGQTLSTDFPLEQPIQSWPGGTYNAFVTRIGPPMPTAVFRSSNGNTLMTTYGSAGLSNAAGTIASAPAISRNSAGDTFVAGRTPAGCVYLNHFSFEGQAWDAAWTLAGCSMSGDPAVIAEPSGGAYVVTRDASYYYWINHYVPGAGFGGWTALGGDFAVDPTIARATDGAIYMVGRNGAGVVASGRYVPGSGFLGWFPDPAAPLATGKPGLTVGADGAAYVAVRSATNSNIWLARLQGDVWGTWNYGGGTAKTDPDLAATAGMIYAAVTNIWDNVYVQAFREGAGNGWQGSWQSLNGKLTKASIAAAGGRYFIAGKGSTAGPIYWYQSGVGWSYIGYPGLAVSELSASPKQ